MSHPIGSFTFVLHAHLPYVLSHGRWPHGMDWLNEATAETYIPLLDMLNDLIQEGLSPHITLGLTPILGEQFSDPTFVEEFRSYMTMKIEAASDDMDHLHRTGQTHLTEIAQYWKAFYQRILDHFETRYQGDLVQAFRILQDKGHIEIITCAATHGYLPLLGQDTSVQAQIKQGVTAYTRQYGRPPRGIWLPECAYRPRYRWAPPVASSSWDAPYLRKGIEEFLAENHIQYFIIDSALLQGGQAIGVYLDRFEGLQHLWERFAQAYTERPMDEEKTPRRAYLVTSSGDLMKSAAILTRDPETGIQVWSGEHGYPGDAWYLDFHKKRFPGGHRYWRVTSAGSDLADKQEYEPERAIERIPEHADHFVGLIKEELKTYYDQTGELGLVCAPYDAELFGHWWFEGPEFLKQVLRRLATDPEVDLTTGSAFLQAHPPTQVISIPEGSWGEGGYHYIWLNEWTEWTWSHIYDDEREMQRLAQQFQSSEDPKLLDILKQAARELLLLQASDWQFLISTWSARDYAELRVAEHHETFRRLARMARAYAEEGSVREGEWAFLEECKERNSVFEDIDLGWFAELEYPAEE